MTIEELKVADGILERIMDSIEDRIRSHVQERPNGDTTDQYDDSWIECNDRLYKQFNDVNKERRNCI